MCGIIGYVGNRKAAPLLLSSLKRLEYRGYDSAGIATLTDDFQVKKDEGRIDDIHSKHNLEDMEGTVGIAHTRWSTHGEPSKKNAHPHISAGGEIIVVHNGIIENHEELREQLEKKGFKFSSDTDTEVLPNLVESHMDEGFEAAVRKALRQIEGSFAFLFMSKNEPDKIIAARNFAPLVLGLGKEEFFAASDVPAFLEHTNRVVYLKDEEYAIITKDGATVKALKTGKEVEYEEKEIDWTSEMAEKGGFSHFTLKEIHEEAEAVAETLRLETEVESDAKTLLGSDRYYIVACGTSYHAGLVMKYIFEKVLGLPAEVIISSEFRHHLNVINNKTAVIAITQSGETADTLSAVRHAKENSAKTFAITNVRGSSITREVEKTFYTCAGPEIGVVATKTFVTQLTVVYMIVQALAKELGKKADYDLEKVPKHIQEIIDREDEFRQLIEEQLNGKDDFYFLGRGLSYPVALEGALKLKEISYLHAEGFAAGELKHGPLALVEDGTPVFCLLPPGEDYKKTRSNLQEVLARGAKAYILSEDEGIKMPKTDELLTPLTYIIPLQLIAYFAAVKRGLDPDKPRNLAKSVTVE